MRGFVPLALEVVGGVCLIIGGFLIGSVVGFVVAGVWFTLMSIAAERAR